MSAISKPPMDLVEMSRELDNIACSPCISSESKLAARHAGELLRAFRSAMNLNWSERASQLHNIALATLRTDEE